MSDAQGPGWWQASDGKWYPPTPPRIQPATAATPAVAVPPEPGGAAPAVAFVEVPSGGPAVPSPPPPGDGLQPERNRRPGKVFAAIGGVAVIALVGAGAFWLMRDGGDQQANERSTPATAVGAESSAAEPTNTGQPPTEPTTSTPATSGLPASTAPPIPRELTPKQQAAAKEATRQLGLSPKSRVGLIDLLTYDDQFTEEDAAIGIDSLDIDWNEQALLSAVSYLESGAYSDEGLFDRLSSPFFAEFTPEQARYAIDSVSVDWNAEAVEAASIALEELDEPSCDEVLDELTDNYRFTPEQAQYGAETAGAC